LSFIIGQVGGLAIGAIPGHPDIGANCGQFQRNRQPTSVLANPEPMPR
jgi:hypothetical protein